MPGTPCHEPRQEAEEFDPELAVTLLADAINACFYLGDLAWVAGAIDRMNRLLSIVHSPRAQILGLMAVGTAEVLAGQGGMDDDQASGGDCWPTPTN